MQYQNYHKHTSYSNVYTKDSPLLVKDYFNRLKQLGDNQSYCTMEHGYQSAYFRIYDELIEFNKENDTNIKFIFGSEIYWVKDRFSNDRANCHMVVLARNDKGRKAINKAISIANKTGYYYKPRLDLELIMGLPKDDVFVTTACLAFWNKYDDIEDIVIKLNNHFNHFYLEIQAHHTEIQKQINAKILKLHNEYNIPMIAGVDSHVIDNVQLEDRDDLLKSSGIRYEEEDGWFLDFPDYNEFENRFKDQGIIPNDKIVEAINNTNVILDFENIVLDRSIKIPTLYPNKTQNEKDIIFIKLIHDLWEEEKKNLPIEKHHLYVEEITKQINEIIGCGMCDYFMTNKKIIEDAINNEGGELTQSGRGSNVAFYLNKLLGFTNIDCISAPIDMYSERFLTKERVLDSKTPPDEDYNVSDRIPFMKAQSKLLGEQSCYDLIAFGTLQFKSAFKMYSRANEIEAQTANEVSKQIDKYEKAMLYAEDEDREFINIFQYVDKEKFGYIIDGCKRYLGIIDGRKAHPCGSLISSCDIEEEVGIILCKSETTKKEVLTALIESVTIDAFGWLKNDFLIVDSTRIINSVYKRIGIKPIEVNDLLVMIENDTKVWDIYANGLTQCINQIEKDKTTQKMMKYKAKNIVELTQFIAGIRPSFQSLYSKFESRQKFEYGIKILDDLLQNQYCESSFILFQEDLMKILAFAGFEIKDTYTIIKAISKKKKKVIHKVKPVFINNFKNKIIESGDAHNDEEALILSEKIWEIVDNFSSYGFNSPHGFSYAIDSVTQAWQKANYPYEFYEVVLQRFTEKGEKDKVAKIKQEMEYFNIKLAPMKFRDDNRKFTSYKEQGYITQPLNSLKSISKTAPEVLYNMKDIEVYNFIDFLTYASENVSLNKTSIEILIKTDYFSEFGTINNLLEIYSMFQKTYKKTYVEKTKIKRIELLNKFSEEINLPTNNIDKIKYQLECLGYSDITDTSMETNMVIITSMEFNQYGTPFANLYYINSGKTDKIKVLKWYYNQKPLVELDVIKIIENKNTKKKWIETHDEYEYIISKYAKVVS